MGRVEKTRLERNWTTFVNPAFCPAWKSPLKMVVWNRPSGIRSQGCCFVSPRWGKSKKRVLNAIWRRSSTRLFALLGKAHSKWWYETDLVEFDPNGVASFRHDGESRKNAFWTLLDDVRQPGFLPCLEKPTQNGGMKPTSWYSILRLFFRFAPMGKVEKTHFERNWTTFVNPAFCPAWKSPLKMVVWNRPSGIRVPRVFFQLSPSMGESRNNTRFERNLTTFGFIPRHFRPGLGKAQGKKPWFSKPTSWYCDPKVVFSTFAHRWAKVEKTHFESQLDDVRFHTTAFCPGLGKAQGKMPWYETDRSGIAIPRVFFRLSPIDGRKSKKRVLNAIGRRSRYHELFALLGKAHSKWWYKTDLVEFDPKQCCFVSPRCRKLKKRRFELNWTTFVNPAFCPAWKSPTQNGGMKPT